MHKKITFVIPSFNGETTLAETIYSVPKDDSVEIVIVDDGSTDSSPDIINSIAEDFPDIIRFFPRQHEGRGATRNFGNSMATADIIAPLDQDDLCLPNRVGVTLDTFEKNPDADIFYSSVIFRYDENGETRKYEAFEIDPKMLWELGRWRICHCTSAYRKKAILAEPYSNDPNQDDWMLWWNFYSKGYKFCFSKEIVSVYRCRSGFEEEQIKDGKVERLIKKKQEIMEPFFKEKYKNEK